MLPTDYKLQHCIEQNHEIKWLQITLNFVEISSEPEVKFGYIQIEDGTDINKEYLQTEKWKQGKQITEKWTNWKHNLLGDFKCTQIY